MCLEMSDISASKKNRVQNDSCKQSVIKTGMCKVRKKYVNYRDQSVEASTAETNCSCWELFQQYSRSMPDSNFKFNSFE
jgi:hypothetical protein